MTTITSPSRNDSSSSLSAEQSYRARHRLTPPIIVIEADGDLECTLDVSETSSDRLSLRLDRSLDRELSHDMAECNRLSSKHESVISHNSNDES